MHSHTDMASNVTKSKVDQLWQEALVEFRKLTNKDLGEVPKISPDDLRRLIEARAKQNDTEENKKRAKARDTALKILACINKLGEVAVQGVSTVFGAADICFKGISLLLDVPKRIREFHEVIDKIFIEIAPVLSQFKIYGRSEQFQAMDEDLLIAIHNVMISLVTICAKAINIEHAGKWQKFKAYASRALCDDEELNEELEKFQMLVKGQQNVQGTVVLESVLETKMNIATIMKSTNEISSDIKGIKEKVQNQEAESSKQLALKKIKTSLGLDKDNDTSKATYEDYMKKMAPQTGNWFKTMANYTSWADMGTAAAGSSSLLLLTGGPGFGKSFTAASVIDDLKRRVLDPVTTKQAHRYLISFWFFPNQSGKAGDEQYPIQTALKWVAFQLAEQDEAYRKRISDIEQLKYAKPSELWGALYLGEPMQRTTHFIVLDGLDNFDRPEELEELFKIFRAVPQVRTNGSSVKILASGQRTKFDALQMSDTSPFGELKADHTTMEHEFRHYIRHKLQGPTMLPGAGLEAKRERIEGKIMKSECSFQTIQATLGAIEGYIASSKSDGELDKLLEDSARDPSVLLLDIVEKLQAVLDIGQIGWVNELLMWVFFGEEQFTIEQLEAAFLLRGKSLPIQGLENFITSRLKKLLTVGPQGLAPVDDNLVKVISKPRELSQDGPDNETISLKITIKNSNISTVQRFLWDLTEFGTLERFSFKSTDKAAQVAQSRGLIRANKTDACLAIVNCFFKFLKEEPNEKWRSIARYLVSYLADHLRALRTAEGDDKITPNEASSIGRRIFELFDYPDAVIKKQWDIFDYSPEFISKENMNEFWEWIRLDTTLNELPERGKDFVTDLKDDVKWERKLLKPMMKMVAKMWLRDRETDPSYPLDWIKAFLGRMRAEDRDAAAKTSNLKEHVASTTTDSPDATAALPTPAETIAANESDAIDTIDTSDKAESSSASTVSTAIDIVPVRIDVEDAAAWCQEILELKDDELDSLWFERLAQTYRETWPRRYKKSVEQYLKAEQRSKPHPPSWEVLTGLSFSLFALGYANQDKACAAHNRAMTLYENSPAVAIEKKVRQLNDMAFWYNKYKRPKKAVEYFETANQLKPDDPDVKYELMNQLLILEQENRVKEMLSKTAESREVSKEETNKGLTPLGSLVRTIAANNCYKLSDIVFWRIVSIIAATGNFAALIEDIDASIGIAKGEKLDYLHPVLVTYKGLAQLHQGGPLNLAYVLECCEKALDITRQNIEKTPSWWLERVYRKTTFLVERFHFNQVSGKGRLPGVVAFAKDHIEAIESSLREYEKYCSGEIGLSASKCYLASYYTLQTPPAVEKARKVFAPDMVRVTNILSDGNTYNDANGYRQLSAVLLHTGDLANAVAGLRLLTPDLTSLGMANVKKVVTQLLCPEGDTPAERSAASQVLSWLEEIDADSFSIWRYDIKSKIDKMIEAHCEHAYPSDHKPSNPATDGVSNGENSVDGNHIVISPEEEKRLQTVRDAFEIYENTYCEACIGSGQCWNFDTDFYACRYCYGVDLCQTCLDKLKAEDPSKPSPLCSPGHDWIRVPKWDVKSWMEAFEGKVRVPKMDEKTGEFVEGDEVVSAAEWLEQVVKPWGISRDNWDVNIKEGEDDQKEAENDGNEMKEGESGGEVNGEKVEKIVNTEKVVEETVSIEKVTSVKVTLEEVTDKTEPQQAAVV